MDALEFAKQKRRMCSSFSTCEECGLYEDICSIGNVNKSIEDDKNIIKIIEKWSKEHPEKTRQSEFLKMFPNAKIDKKGALAVPPCRVDISYGVEENKVNCCSGKSCPECCREYWLTPLEEG